MNSSNILFCFTSKSFNPVMKLVFICLSVLFYIAFGLTKSFGEPFLDFRKLTAPHFFEHNQGLFKIQALPRLQVFQANIEKETGDSVVFNAVNLGDSSSILLSFVNAGDDTLRISSFFVSGQAFSLVAGWPNKIPGGDTAAVPIKFKGKLPVGFSTAQLLVVSNDALSSNFSLILFGRTAGTGFAQSKLEIRHISNNQISTSGQITPDQLQPRFLLSDNAGIKWYATWDTTHLYVVKIGGNRVQPQLIYIRASYPGAVYTDVPTNYDGFSPNFTGIGGINFGAYLKETTVPYDEFRTWNGTIWSAPSPSLMPLYGNQGQDIFALRIPWNDMTQGHGIPDSIRMVFYQINGPAGANFFAYAQSPSNLPFGNAVTPPIGFSHNKTIIHRLAPNAEFDFGSLPTGRHADTTFLLFNNGEPGSEIQVNGPCQLVGSDYSALNQTQTGTFIGDKQWKAIKIRYAPSTLGSSFGSLTANASFGNPQGNYTIRFKGTGLGQPEARLMVKFRGRFYPNNSSIDLGLAEIQSSIDTSAFLHNVGTDTLRINNIGVFGDWIISRMPASIIAPGDSSLIRLRKNSVVVGLDSGGSRIGSNDPNVPNFDLRFRTFGDSALAWYPPFPSINDSIQIVYNPQLGNKELATTNPIYVHTGVITSGIFGTNWENIQGNFNSPADSVKCEAMGNGKQRLKFLIKDFYNLPGSPIVFRLGMVFRNALGTLVGRTRQGGDFFIRINQNPSAPRVNVMAGRNAPLVNGSTIHFGNVGLGSTKDTIVTIKNVGLANLVFSLINISGFSYTQVGTSNDIIPPGDSTTVRIRLSVQGNGPLVGFLNLQSNASNAPQVLVNLVANDQVEVESMSNFQALKVYPNPATDELKIELPDESFKHVAWQIVDAMGRIVGKGDNLLASHIDIRSIPTGVYSLVINKKRLEVYRFAKL